MVVVIPLVIRQREIIEIGLDVVEVAIFVIAQRIEEAIDRGSGSI